MKRVLQDLWETQMENPFPGLTTHAYLLRREAGNILFYNTGHAHEIEAMADLGGVTRQLLSHRDEVGPAIKHIRERHHAKLGGHQRERDEIAAVCEPDMLFHQREIILGNIEVIPTPGHSPGSTCFLASAEQGRRYLFTGDTIYLTGGTEWKAGLIPSISNRDQLIESLELLRTLQPDVVISSAFSGPAGIEEMSRDQWPLKVGRALTQLKGST